MQPLFEPIQIRYEGLDAANHALEMHLAAPSISGIAQIARVAADFALTHDYVGRPRNSSVRILMRPPSEKCFHYELIAVAATQYPLITDFIKHISFELMTSIMSAIFLRRSGRSQEMDRHLDVIDKLLEQSGADRLDERQKTFELLNRALDAVQPAVRRAITPIGQTCGSVEVGEEDYGGAVIDFATKEAILSKDDAQIGDEAEYIVRLDGLSLKGKNCRALIVDGDGRIIPGKITDPAILLVENVYTDALHRQVPLRIRAKSLIREGRMATLYISDARPLDAARAKAFEA